MTKNEWAQYVESQAIILKRASDASSDLLIAGHGIDKSNIAEFPEEGLISQNEDLHDEINTVGKMVDDIKYKAFMNIIRCLETLKNYKE